MENLMNSSDKQEKKSQNNVMDLIADLYDSREVMPMKAEPEETMMETDNGATT